MGIVVMVMVVHVLLVVGSGNGQGVVDEDDAIFKRNTCILIMRMEVK